MARTNEAQLNIRSRFARDRVTALARQTGMTATQVVEEALRAYAPPVEGAPPAGLVRRGRILVMPASGRPVTVADVEETLDEIRNERC
ncbi:hypothetical protein [uncultured Sphingomonas sp.]|uniref:hypothetical protein n=1 Tax=uncultured Sphingomonas sp. TaxID=158754 RepID=UPI0035C9A10F